MIIQTIYGLSPSPSLSLSPSLSSTLLLALFVFILLAGLSRGDSERERERERGERRDVKGERNYDEWTREKDRQGEIVEGKREGGHFRGGRAKRNERMRRG